MKKYAQRRYKGPPATVTTGLDFARDVVSGSQKRSRIEFEKKSESTRVVETEQGGDGNRISGTGDANYAGNVEERSASSTRSYVQGDDGP